MMGGTSEGLKAAAESGCKGKYREVPRNTRRSYAVQQYSRCRATVVVVVVQSGSPAERVKQSKVVQQ